VCHHISTGLYFLTKEEGGGGYFKNHFIMNRCRKTKQETATAHNQKMKSINFKLFSILTDERTGARAKQLAILHSWIRRGIQIHMGIFGTNE